MIVKPKVYVVQNHLRYDSERGELVPVHNISPAERFGTLTFILNPRATIQRPAEVIAKMDLILAGYRDEDYLLLIGHPALIGWATAIAAANNGGRVNLLVWSSKDRDYSPVSAHLPIRHASV
jgi:sugar/nucleoside kinase (ribokinase family)